MAKYAILQTFYASDIWRNFRLALILERSKEKGGVICADCGKLIARPIDIHAHHKIELTPENFNDYNISLNPIHIDLICHSCHDKKHYRFGHKPQKEIFIVYGPPMAGKKTFVKENMERGDIVVDMDRLYEAVSMQSCYDKPDNLFSNVIGIRSLLLDNLKTRYGKWYNAWVIGGYADKFKRERLAEELGAELVYIQTNKEECYARLNVDKDRQYRVIEWKKYIDEWFEKYS
jgi:predicted kinase